MSAPATEESNQTAPSFTNTGEEKVDGKETPTFTDDDIPF